MNIGYDSPTVLREHVNEMLDYPFRLLAVLLEASDQRANCRVCQVELGPYPDDPNHHCALNNHDISDQVYHYCDRHCPTCNRRETDAPPDDHSS